MAKQTNIIDFDFSKSSLSYKYFIDQIKTLVESSPSGYNYSSLCYLHIRVPNTKNLSIDFLKELDSLNADVQISVTGGLDYKKKKFNEKSAYYTFCTLYEPSELIPIIKEFEEIEKGINPKWTELQKAMYVYKVLTEQCHYTCKDDNKKAKDGTKRDIIRSYRGLCNRHLTCLGFALVYKEMMDRLGIKCHFCQKYNEHCWNMLEIDGRYIPVDLSDSCAWHHKNHDVKCKFYYFGSNDFYKILSNGTLHHKIIDNEEFDFEHSPKLRFLTQREIQSNAAVISKPYVKKNTDSVKKDYIPNTFGGYFGDLYRKVFSIPVAPQKKAPSGDSDTFLIEEYNGKCVIGYNDGGNIRAFILNSEQGKNLLRGGTYNVNSLPGVNINCYTRMTGETFYVCRSLRGNNEYLYIEMNGKRNDIKKITCDNQLDSITDSDMKRKIADMLLSKSRLERRISSYNGYVGGISEGNITYSRIR